VRIETKKKFCYINMVIMLY